MPKWPIWERKYLLKNYFTEKSFFSITKSSIKAFFMLLHILSNVYTVFPRGLVLFYRWKLNKTSWTSSIYYTCPWSSYSFNTVTYYIKWATISWTSSTNISMALLNFLYTHMFCGLLLRVALIHIGCWCSDLLWEKI